MYLVTRGTLKERFSDSEFCREVTIVIHLIYTCRWRSTGNINSYQLLRCTRTDTVITNVKV